MNKRSRFSLIMFLVTMLFFYIPLVVLIIFSFNADKGNVWAGFSFRWYEELFTNGQLWRAFLNSVLIALFSGFTATVIGTLGALGIQWYKFKHKKYLQIVTYLPLIIPELIIGVSLLIFFSKVLPLKLNLFTVYLAHTTFNIPFVLFIIMSRLEEFDYSIIEASYDLGANEVETLHKVTILMIMPGIISGFLMSVTLSLDDFVITKFVAGDGVSMLPLMIFRIIKSGQSPVVNALSVILVALTIILAIASRKIHKYMFK